MLMPQVKSNPLGEKMGRLYCRQHLQGLHTEQLGDIPKYPELKYIR